MEILEAEAISPSPYFNPHLYRVDHMPADAKATPALKDFLRRGLRKGISPNRIFVPQWYRERYPDVPSDDTAAILHFVTEGDFQHRFPGPNFDPDWYLSAYPDIRSARLAPLWHFLAFGMHEGRNPVNSATRRARVVDGTERDLPGESKISPSNDPFSTLAKYQTLTETLAT